MMNFRYTMVTLLLTICSASQANPLYWGQSGALERLMHSQYHGDFAKLSNYHESQENKMFCGVATAVTILNALEIGQDDIPLDESLVSPVERRHLPTGDWTPVFHKWTQTTVLHANVKTKKQILGKPKAGNEDNKDYGLQLYQFAELLSAHGAKVEFKCVFSSQKITQ